MESKEFEICCVRCPFCGQSVTATVKRERIHCPECKQSAPYKDQFDPARQKIS